MIFKNQKHDNRLYNTLLSLSRNIFFYKKLRLHDTFETRIYLMFFHYSIMLLILKEKKTKSRQNDYDNFFGSIENNLRELGFGDVSVNKKMKDLNKIFYDILLKINVGNNIFKINEELIFKYFDYINSKNNDKISDFKLYFVNFHKFCSEHQPNIMLEEAINFNY